MEFKRKRLGKTNYKKRLKLLLANKPRLVIRKSNNNIIAQIVEYNTNGDKVKLSCHSSELKKHGWNGNTGNVSSAYLVGLIIGNKSKDKKIDCVLDIGLQNSVKGSRIYSVLKGCVDAGLNVPHSKDILPSEDKIKGKDAKNFEEVKKKILGA
ncbi:MAG: 50S ribosomal protein L18 [Nanoarchaeota archaeon]|nr:50S ribosomal protein L18 [Nanoarchaeota archaeon]